MGESEFSLAVPESKGQAGRCYSSLGLNDEMLQVQALQANRRDGLGMNAVFGVHLSGQKNVVKKCFQWPIPIVILISKKGTCY
jgi:hypothetical protein